MVQDIRTVRDTAGSRDARPPGSRLVRPAIAVAMLLCGAGLICLGLRDARNGLIVLGGYLVLYALGIGFHGWRGAVLARDFAQEAQRRLSEGSAENRAVLAEAAIRFDAKVRAVSRKRTALFLICAATGGGLVYLGLSVSSHVATVVGGALLLCSLLLRFYIRRPSTILREFRRMIDQVGSERRAKPSP